MEEMIKYGTEQTGLPLKHTIHEGEAWEMKWSGEEGWQRALRLNLGQSRKKVFDQVLQPGGVPSGRRVELTLQWWLPVSLLHNLVVLVTSLCSLLLVK